MQKNTGFGLTRKRKKKYLEESEKLKNFLLMTHYLIRLMQELLKIISLELIFQEHYRLNIRGLYQPLLVITNIMQLRSDAL